MGEFFRKHHVVAGRAGIAVFAVVIVIALQAAVFHRLFTPRIAAANETLSALVTETAQRERFGELRRQVDRLASLQTEADTRDRSLRDGWQEFAEHFAAAPREALAAFREELPVLLAGIDLRDETTGEVEERVAALEALYANDFRDLVDDLRQPPLWLQPAAGFVADGSGYRHAATFNRALYLSQTGDIGTARVMLAGLNATVDDPELLARVYYLLARLQFALFVQTPEIEYYTQSLQYLRQSLAEDPGGILARRLLDFLLSLPQSATAPQSAEGRPETPSEGEGAAISVEKRVF